MPTEDARIGAAEPSNDERNRRLAGLYEEHALGLRHLLLGLLRDRAEAEEALQQVFVKLLESWEAVQPETAKGWLYTVAFHEAMARRRRHGVHETAMNELWARPVWQSGRESVDPVNLFFQGQQIEELRRAVGGLPDVQREVVERRMFRDQTFAVIAHEIGCPLNTVLSRMRLAVENLRRFLGD